MGDYVILLLKRRLKEEKNRLDAFVIDDKDGIDFSNEIVEQEIIIDSIQNAIEILQQEHKKRTGGWSF